MTEMPDGWNRRPLGELLELLMDHRGRTPGKLGGEFQNHGVPVISAIHIKGGQIDFSRRERFVSQDMFERWMPERLRRGDVLLTSEAPMGSIALVPSDAPLVLSQRLFALRGRAGLLDNRYLRWALESQPIREQLDRRSSGTTVTGIRRGELVQVELPLPSLSEQRLIVDILEDHLSRLDVADQLMVAAGRRSELLGAVTLEALAPMGTLHKTLGELATDSGYGTSTKCVVDGPGVPVVRIPNLSGGRVDLADEKRAADRSVDLNHRMLEPDDLLIVRTNGSRDLIGRAAVVQPGISASFASYLIRFRVDSSQARPQWVRIMLGAPSARRVLESMAASSAGQYNLGLKKLNGITLPCPSLDQQDRLLARFDEKAWAYESLRRGLEVGRTRTASLRRSVLAAAFSGRLTGRASDVEIVEEMAGV